MNGRCYKCNNPLTTGDFDGMCNDCKKQQNDTEISIVEKALTPPTAEEVCKALSKFVGREVSYTNKQFHYIIKNTQVLIYVTETYNNKTFSLGVYLPPHLITLIGRFYEGEIK